MGINIYDKNVNVREAASRPDAPSTTHGMSSAQIDELHKRFSSFSPSLTTRADTSSSFRNLFQGDLPAGADWSATRTAQSHQLGGHGGGQGRQMTTVQTPYQPEFASPDRQQYPVHRILANRYWRLFYKLDPVIGNCVDLYSDLPWSNFELTGEGIEGEIRQAYEYMCRETQVLALLPHFVREFLVVGEAVPHTFFDNAKGVFTYIALHNPDQLEVTDAPFIKMEPVLEFIPDDRLRAILTSDQPALRKIREKMPTELINRLNARQNIPLSSLNATFIPRKLHPYDTRGTSMISRMWRVLMLEDAVFNATIQTARRHAAPLKVAKLGNPQSGWIPPPEQEKRLLELLAQAELDPNAWLVYHYGIQFDTIGTTDRVMSVNREWDVIERIKLVAMGISKSFLHGEVSYASSATGLQVFMQRLKTMRMFFEQKWLYPKFFRPIAEINGWIKPKPAEVAHRFRVKRSARELEEQNAYIIPKIIWDKSLDPQVNSELINAIAQLEGIGVKFSKTTKMASVGYSYEEETKKIQREQEFEKQFLPKITLPSQSEDAGGGMGGGGGGMPPPGSGGGEEEGQTPPGVGGEPPPGVNGPPAAPKPPGASLAVQGDEGPKSVKDLDKPKPAKSSHENLKSEIWNDDKFGNWKADEVSDLVELIETGETDSAFWTQLAADEAFRTSAQTRDPETMWEALDNYLIGQNYPERDIKELRHILEAEAWLQSSQAMQLLDGVEDALPDNADSLSDEQFASVVGKLIKKNKNKITNDNNNFLTGMAAPDTSGLMGDISELIPRKKK